MVFPSEQKRSANLLDNTLRQIMDNTMTDSYKGVAWAGAVFGGCQSAFLSYQSDTSLFIPFTGMGIAIGLLFASLFCLWSGAVVTTIFQAFELRTNPEFAATTAGGFTAFALLLGQAVFYPSKSWWGFFIPIILAVTFAQFGAAWYATDSVVRQIKSQAEKTGLSCQQIRTAIYDRQRQFQLWQLISAVLIAAIVMSVCRTVLRPTTAANLILLVGGWAIFNIVFTPLTIVAARQLRSFRADKKKAANVS